MTKKSPQIGVTMQKSVATYKTGLDTIKIGVCIHKKEIKTFLPAHWFLHNTNNS